MASVVNKIKLLSLMLLLCPAIYITAGCTYPTLPNCEAALNEIKSNYFKSKDLEATLLIGGHSNISLLITFNNQRYVLRIKREQAPIMDLKRELYVMQEAAALGIAPRIYYITDDFCAVLMEYIDKDTLSLKESKQPDTIKKIARSLAQAHSIPPFPIPSKSGTESAKELYDSLSKQEILKPWLDEALELMLNYEEELSGPNPKQITGHGDLNPRNIFVTAKRALFIDWEYSGSEDPFMDSSYLALRLDYTPREEFLFLESYLQRAPTDKEMKHYYLAKKLNCAQLVFFFFYFSIREKQKEQCEWDLTAPIKELYHYIKIYVDKEDQNISLAQYYFELAQACLNRARET